MADKLYITISDKRKEGDGKPTPQPNTNPQDDETSIFQRYAEHQLFSMIKNQSIKAVNYQISNIGNFTGDYISQRKVNEMKGAISTLMGIGMATYSGAKVGGGAGAVVGFVVGVSGVVINSVYENYSNLLENQKTNYSISQLRERAGLNTYTDGSRGTEN